MKTCNECKYANWSRKSNGTLHPSGDGHCTYSYVIKKLPASMSFVSGPYIIGGAINRKMELKEDCAYYTRIDNN